MRGPTCADVGRRAFREIKDLRCGHPSDKANVANLKPNPLQEILQLDHSSALFISWVTTPGREKFVLKLCRARLRSWLIVEVRVHGLTPLQPPLITMTGLAFTSKMTNGTTNSRSVDI